MRYPFCLTIINADYILQARLPLAPMTELNCGMHWKNMF